MWQIIALIVGFLVIGLFAEGLASLFSSLLFGKSEDDSKQPSRFTTLGKIVLTSIACIPTVIVPILTGIYFLITKPKSTEFVRGWLTVGFVIASVCMLALFLLLRQSRSLRCRLLTEPDKSPTARIPILSPLYLVLAALVYFLW